MTTINQTFRVQNRIAIKLGILGFILVVVLIGHFIAFGDFDVAKTIFQFFNPVAYNGGSHQFLVVPE